MIDGQTNTVLATIPLSIQEAGGGIAVNQRTDTVYVTNFGLNTMLVIDGQTNAVVTTVPVGKFPEGVAANPKTDTVYVTNNGDNTVSVLTSSQG